MTEAPNGNILVVDDDPIATELLQETLRRSGHRTRGVFSGEEALELLAREPADLVITDIRMGGMSGLDLVRTVCEKYPGTLCIVVTAFGDSSATIGAMQAGAFDFLNKPFDMAKIRRIVANALEKKALVQETEDLEPVATVKENTNRIIGSSEQMVDVFKLIGRVANTESTVLICGESGTGKELVARALHENSYRRDKPFLALNCGALPETLLESELFGYEKGAFTGADKSRAGIFESVDGGSCMLDEVGEMPLAMQAKLLRVLQEGEIRRVGSTKEIRVDVRILAATHRDLEAMVRDGAFREDLYYRLNVVRIELPSLRERPGDIPLLAEHFLSRYMSKNRKKGLQLSRETLQILATYSWPGNVRELENVVESAATLSPTPIITPDCLPARLRSSAAAETFLERQLPQMKEGVILPLAEMEKAYILKVLKDLSGNKSQAARMLGLDRKTLRLKLKQYGYDTEGDDRE